MVRTHTLTTTNDDGSLVIHENCTHFSRVYGLSCERKSTMLCHFAGSAKKGAKGGATERAPTLTRLTPIAESSAKLS